MRIYSLIAIAMCFFIGCSKEDTPQESNLIKTQFSLQTPVVNPQNGHSFNNFMILYSKKINSQIEATLNFTGTDFDTTFTVIIEANYKGAPTAFGSVGNVVTGFAKEFKNETSKRVLEGKMLSIKADDPKYKFEILTKN